MTKAVLPTGANGQDDSSHQRIRAVADNRVLGRTDPNLTAHSSVQVRAAPGTSGDRRLSSPSSDLPISCVEFILASPYRRAEYPSSQ